MYIADAIKLTLRRRDCKNKPNVITKTFKNGRERQKSKNSRNGSMRKTQSELLTLNIEKGPRAKECQWHLYTIKGKEMDSSLEPPEEIYLYECLNFNPVRPMLDF